MDYFDLVLVVVIAILLFVLILIFRQDEKYDGELQITEQEGKEQFRFIVSDEVLDSELKKTSLKFKVVDTREKHSQ